MKVYNKPVIEWLLGQQQFCLTLERICCNRSLLGSNMLLSSNPVNNCILLPVSRILVIFKHSDNQHIVYDMTLWFLKQQTHYFYSNYIPGTYSKLGNKTLIPGTKYHEISVHVYVLLKNSIV